MRLEFLNLGGLKKDLIEEEKLLNDEKIKLFNSTKKVLLEISYYRSLVSSLTYSNLGKIPIKMKCPICNADKVYKEKINEYCGRFIYICSNCGNMGFTLSAFNEITEEKGKDFRVDEDLFEDKEKAKK